MATNNPSTVIERAPFQEYEYSIPESSGISLKFPPNLGDENTENEAAILFKFHSAIPGQKPKNLPQTYVGLPIPKELDFGEIYKYSDKEGVTDTLDGKLLSALERFGKGIAGVLTAQGADRANRSAGRGVNNKSALIFDGVEFRTYSFSWDLIPRNEAESKIIFGIIKNFRIAASAEFQSNNETTTYFDYPDLVSFIFKTPGTETQFHASYPCFITDINHKPIANESQIMFYKNGAPQGWTLTLVLKESLILSRADILVGPGGF